MSEFEASFSIIPATLADLPVLARLLCDTKLTLKINRLLWKDWPNEILQLSKCRRAIEGSFGNPASKNLKLIDNDSGEIIGHLTLTPRNLSAEKVQLSADQKPAAPEPGMNAEVALAVNNAITILSAKRNDEHLGTQTPPLKFSCVSLY
jgi:hypothetical protein